MASAQGHIGLDGWTAYAGAKGAVMAMTRQMAVEFGPMNIRVNSISPGTINTPMNDKLIKEIGGNLAKAWVKMHPIGRIGEPSEVAEAAIYLASDAAGFTTGTDLRVDGGLTAAPATFQTCCENMKRDMNEQGPRRRPHPRLQPSAARAVRHAAARRHGSRHHQGRARRRRRHVPWHDLLRQMGRRLGEPEFPRLEPQQAVDRAQPEEPKVHAIVMEMAKTADVVVQNFRPGVLAKLGYGYEDFKAVNPRIIYCSGSGYGEDGPYVERPGQDMLIQGLAGLISNTGRGDQAPVPAGAGLPTRSAP